MGILKALQRRNELNLHPHIRAILEGIEAPVRKGDLAGLLANDERLPALAVLDEFSKQQTRLGSHEDQVARAERLKEEFRRIKPRNLRVFVREHYLRALDEATDHPQFSIAKHLGAFANFLRATSAFTAPRKNMDIQRFPTGTTEAFLALASDPKFDMSTNDGILRYRQAIDAVRRATHPNLRRLFLGRPVFFATLMTFASSLPPEEIRRRIRGRGPLAKETPWQRDMLKPVKEEAPRRDIGKIWESILEHPALHPYLKKNAGIPRYSLVSANAPTVLDKLNLRQNISSGGSLGPKERRVIFAWALKAVKGIERRDWRHEQYLMRAFDSGHLEGERNGLEKLLAALDRMHEERKK